MVAVDLRSDSGGKVATIEVPDQPTRPGIVKWGSRYYARCTESVYVETWCYAAPVGATVVT